MNNHTTSLCFAAVFIAKQYITYESKKGVDLTKNAQRRVSLIHLPWMHEFDASPKDVDDDAGDREPLSTELIAYKKAINASTTYHRFHHHFLIILCTHHLSSSSVHII